VGAERLSGDPRGVAMPADKRHSTKQEKVYLEPFVDELVTAYFQDLREKPRKQSKGKFGFCYVNTPFGTLELRIDSLLYMTAGMLKLIIGNPRRALMAGEMPDNMTVVTDWVVETSLEVIDRIPTYMVNDLVGMIMESQFDVYARDEGKPEVWRTLQEKLSSAAGDRFGVNLLSAFFQHWGILSLEMDSLRTVFRRVVATKGIVGKPWKLFLSKHFREKKKRGRPRSTEYDRLLERRTVNPETETYGKLIRDIVAAASVPPDVARNRLKSAAAYRRKKLRSRLDLEAPPAGKKNS